MTKTITPTAETESTKVTKFGGREFRKGVRETLPRTERFEFREGSAESPPMLVGLAARTETPYTVEEFAGSFSETIERGAFARTLADNPDVVLLVEHSGLPLARTASRTLELRETDSGLEVRAELDPSDPDVAQLLPKLRRGDMNQMSIAFRVNKQTWSEDYSDRRIHEINLARGDVSVVTFAANPQTEALIRSALAARAAEPETESAPEVAPEPPTPDSATYAEADITAIIEATAKATAEAIDGRTETPPAESLREQHELTAQVLDRLSQVVAEAQAEINASGNQDA